jgi:hypothetical protein
MCILNACMSASKPADSLAASTRQRWGAPRRTWAKINPCKLARSMQQRAAAEMGFLLGKLLKGLGLCPESGEGGAGEGCGLLVRGCRGQGWGLIRS